MTNRIFSILILFTTVFACRVKKQETQLSLNTDSLAYALRLSQRDSVYDKYKANTIDTSVYRNFKQWDSSFRRYSNLYIDTFNINGNKFRLVSPFDCNCNGGNSIFLQKKQNGKWINTGTFFSDNIHGGNLERNRDINNDGYPDIINETRFTQDVYFFNPFTGNFLDTASANINPEWALIDSGKNIYCDFQDFKQMSGQIHSGLYTFHGFNQYYFYNLELDNNQDPGTITALILNKCMDGSTDNPILIQKIKLPRAIDLTTSGDNYFDYKNYWKKRYKSLLGYR